MAEQVSKECPEATHDYEPISWERNIWGDRVARHLACRKCGKVISTGVRFESDLTSA